MRPSPLPRTRRRLNRPVVAAVTLGIVTATLEMGALLWMMYC